MKISLQKKEKICEQILALLFSIAPRAAFTATIAKEIARDEEFVKTLLFEMKQKRFVIHITKNPKGILYRKRSRWRLSDATYQAYTQKQGGAL